MTKIVVVTGDPVTASMAGPAIRAWHMARVLAAAGHEVRLLSTIAADRTHPAFAVEAAGEAGLRAAESWCDVVVFQGGLLHSFPFLMASGKVFVADVYDPFHLENFEGTRAQRQSERFATIARLTTVLNEQLLRADFFLCATTRQRDFWLGSLAALGRVNPATYEADPHLASLIAVAPFGVSDEAPVATGHPLRGTVAGIVAGDEILLWAGGVYDWFDPITLLNAVDALRTRRPRVRLVFLGMRHPHPDIPPMRKAVELQEQSDRRGLTGSHVFFNTGWVPYEERVGYLLDADVGVSCHLDHLETAFSFRTRMLDYLWAGLPIVATGGDELGELVEREAIGATVAPGDAPGLAAALDRVLTAPPPRERVQAVARRYEWETVLAPLVAFCAAPSRAPDAGLVVRPGPLVMPEARRDPGGGRGWRMRRRG